SEQSKRGVRYQVRTLQRMGGSLWHCRRCCHSYAAPTQPTNPRFTATVVLDRISARPRQAKCKTVPDFRHQKGRSLGSQARTTLKSVGFLHQPLGIDSTYGWPSFNSTNHTFR